MGRAGLAAPEGAPQGERPGSTKKLEPVWHVGSHLQHKQEDVQEGRGRLSSVDKRGSEAGPQFPGQGGRPESGTRRTGRPQRWVPSGALPAARSQVTLGRKQGA